jgi:hypothetical protein
MPTSDELNRRRFLGRLGLGTALIVAGGCGRSRRTSGLSAMDQERIARDKERRSRHLQHCEDHIAKIGEKRTTPPPAVDVTTIVPELAERAKTTVRLHPRYGREPAPDASKIGGRFLWPEEELWPRCEEHAIPYVTVLQLRAEEYPELEFPPDADLFQLLWCPRDHEMWIKPAAFWRRRANVKNALAAPPQHADVFMNYVPVPCVLLPERVTEFPGVEELPEETRRRLAEGLKARQIPGPTDRTIESQVLEFYQDYYEIALSVCPGTKVGGYVRWDQSPQVPKCDCGRAMDHLVTISSDEFDGASYVRWLPAEERHLWDGRARAMYGWADAPGLMLGDLGKVYFFVCRQCKGWPIKHVGQC